MLCTLQYHRRYLEDAAASLPATNSVSKDDGVSYLSVGFASLPAQ
jgi:hypothetical protein